MDLASAQKRGVGLRQRKSSSTFSSSSSASSPSSPPFWQSNGDYGADAARHEDSSLPLYSQQAQLPRLPLPSLSETAQKVWQSTLPLCRSEQERVQLHQAVQQFPQQAQVLHERLQQRQQEQQSKDTTSWLQQWWNQVAYFQVRDSNTINVSYFFHETNPTTATTKSAADDDAATTTTTNDALVERGAAILRETALYAQPILKGIKPVDRLGRRQIPLCSTQYKYLFGASRIPRPKQDAYRVYNQLQQHQLQQYAIVACRHQFYKVPLMMENEVALSESILKRHLEACLQHAQQQQQHGGVPPLGWLTATHRDRWAGNYQWLTSKPEFAKAIEVLQGGLFLLALDENVNVVRPPLSSSSSMTSASSSYAAAQLLHGNGTHTANRWWDKSIQVVLLMMQNNKNSNPAPQEVRMGLVGEHSMSDGMPATGLFSHLLQHTQQQQQQQQQQPTVAGSSTTTDDDTSSSSLVAAEPIFQSAWESLTPTEQDHLKEAIREARDDDVLPRIDALDLLVLEYTRYGTNAIRKAGYPPDAFAQLALQLASFPVFAVGAAAASHDGKEEDVEEGPVGTYESSQTRQFLHGRTETIRSVSMESTAFVRAMRRYQKRKKQRNSGSRGQMEEQSLTETEMRDLTSLLEAALDSHVQYSRNASQGMGADRHLLGLSMVARQQDNDNENEALPDLFQLNVFSRAKRWRLSTSTLPNMAPGFGPVEPDGVGVGYDLRPDCMIFSISGNNNNNNKTNSAPVPAVVPHMTTALEMALNDMAVLFLNNDTNNIDNINNDEKKKEEEPPPLLPPRSRL